MYLSSALGFRKDFLVIALTIALTISLSPILLEASALTLLQADRPEIKLRRSTDDAFITMDQLIIGGNITGVNVVSTNLFDEQEQRGIKAANIVVTPNTFDINTSVDSGTKLLNITIDARGAQPGVYTGKLYLINASTQFTIPITLTIHYNIWGAFGLIAFGVVISFLIKYLAKYYDEINKKKMALLQSESVDALTGDARRTKLAEIEEAIKLEKPEIRATALKHAVGNKPALYIALVSALMIIAMLTAWQGYYTNLAAFGRTPLDFIAAFLFGFAGNAILAQAIDLKRPIS